ncbi:CRF domain-containing protein [Nephila pilipes]|uniref:CRF domain-containing protein n=1 Tax=Nephila pilipes TaxID=299642 RepID=A0A8X6N0P5_NEPPI|nr:CRF domain-containing protein [Nephila pilipes]
MRSSSSRLRSGATARRLKGAETKGQPSSSQRSCLIGFVQELSLTMLSGTTIFSLFLTTIVIMLHDSSCHGYQMMAAYPLSSSFEERHLHRREPANKPEDSAAAYPKLTSDIFGSNSEESSDKSRMHEENDSSLSSDEAASMLDFSINHPSQFTKRRKGPTLSVVNPLERTSEKEARPASSDSLRKWVCLEMAITKPEAHRRLELLRNSKGRMLEPEQY